MSPSPSVNELEEALEAFAPRALASTWDRVGLHIGSHDLEIKGVLVALDPSLEAVRYAVSKGLNFLITHHPIFFRPLEALHYGDATAKLLEITLQNRICIFSAHTNLDAVSPHGINDLLGALLHLKDLVPLAPFSNANAGGRTKASGDGLGRIGLLPEALRLRDLILKVKTALKVENVRFVGDPEQVIRKVAVCSGAGGDFVAKARAAGVDCYVTADIRYHEALDAKQNSFALIDPGHFAMETIMIPLLAGYLRRYFQEKDWQIVVEEYKEGSDPFQFA